MKKYLSLILIISILNTTAFTQIKPQKVGADKDKHGCIGSAGYVYSLIKNDCIRVFEQNLKLNQVNPKGSSTSIAAVVFSKDSLKAEVFLSNYNGGQILTKKVSQGKLLWQKGNLKLTRKEGFELFENSKLICRQN